VTTIAAEDELRALLSSESAEDEEPDHDQAAVAADDGFDG
jgi:trk system potassium uptake protein TrkA